jgi:tRNA-specific 2-thiouridylase
VSEQTQKTAGPVVVAMSGGVDSSVAAALLVEQGHDVIGISLRLAPDDPANTSGCCGVRDFADAARVAELLGIPHYTMDMRSQFREKVMMPFAAEYLAGRTPSPCVLCNREIKFSLLFDRARALGATRVATGHYARTHNSGNTVRLLKGLDDNKDQSYFLFEMGQEQLAHTLFPVGDLSKAEVREHAQRLGLQVADKPDSHDICFVPPGGYAAVVERLKGLASSTPGKLVSGQGQTLGEHDGVHHFTVGQRRGLGISADQPLYVTGINADTGEVRVGGREQLACSGLLAERPCWVSGDTPREGSPVEARIRYRHAAVPATVNQTGGKLTVIFDAPEEAVAPGQAVVFYDGDEVLGGAWIQQALHYEHSVGTEQCA